MSLLEFAGADCYCLRTQGRRGWWINGLQTIVSGHPSLFTLWGPVLICQAWQVYQILCSSCEKVHIGQTGRTLDHHSKEHRRALISGNVQQLAVAEHATNEMHVINWEKAEVVDCHPHYCQRCALDIVYHSFFSHLIG